MPGGRSPQSSQLLPTPPVWSPTWPGRWQDGRAACPSCLRWFLLVHAVRVSSSFRLCPRSEGEAALTGLITSCHFVASCSSPLDTFTDSVPWSWSPVTHLQPSLLLKPMSPLGGGASSRPPSQQALRGLLTHARGRSTLAECRWRPCVRPCPTQRLVLWTTALCLPHEKARRVLSDPAGPGQEAAQAPVSTLHINRGRSPASGMSLARTHRPPAAGTPPDLQARLRPGCC